MAFDWQGHSEVNERVAVNREYIQHCGGANGKVDGWMGRWMGSWLIGWSVEVDGGRCYLKRSGSGLRFRGFW